MTELQMKIIDKLQTLEKKEKVCAFCHDTKWMLVTNSTKMKGIGRNRPCVWCRDGKENMDDDSLVFLDDEWNRAITKAMEVVATVTN